MILEQASQPPMFRPFDQSGPVLLFRDTWRVILRGWRVFLPLLIVLAGLLFIELLINGSSELGAIALTSFAQIVGYLLCVLAEWLTIVALIVAADAVSERSEMSLEMAYDGAMRRFWPYLLTSIVVALVVLEGGILFIVPGIVLLVAVGPAVYAVVIEGLNSRQALARARFLTAGSGWAILLRVIVFWFFCLLLFWIPLAVAFGPPDMLWLELPPVGLHVWRDEEPDPRWFAYAWILGTALWSLLFTVFMVLVVKSLRAKLGEGFAPPPRWPAAVFVAIGVVLTLISIPGFIQTRDFLQRAVPVMGTLVPPTFGTYEVGFLTLTLGSAVTAEYTTPDGERRELHSFFTLMGVTDQPYGSPIPVLFDAEHPSEARIDGGLFIWGGFVCGIGLGVVLLLVGVAQWLYLRSAAGPGESPILSRRTESGAPGESG